MSIIDTLTGLTKCTYKDMQLFITKEKLTSVGQKYIIHDYPNSDARYAEAMGTIPREFELDVVFFGDTFREDFEQFIQLIQQPQSGTLVLPTFGIIDNVIALPASAEHDYNEYGSIIMSVKFTETINVSFGGSSNNNIVNDIANAWNSLTANISTTVFNFSKTITPTLNNIKTVQRDIKSAMTTISKVVGFVEQIVSFYNLIVNATAGGLTGYNSTNALTSYLFGLNSGYLYYVATNFTDPKLTNKYASLVTTGNNLSTNMYEINQEIILPQTPLQAGQIPNYTIPIWAGDTLEQQQRNNLRYTIINGIRLWALIMLCMVSADAVLNTVQDVINIKNLINNLFNIIIDEDTSGILIPKTKRYMNALKNSTLSLLNNRQISAYQTTIINLEKVISPLVLAYELYGEFIQNENDLNAFKQLLIQLNNNYPAHAFGPGQVTIITIG
jgi:hypothetical protein